MNLERMERGGIMLIDNTGINLSPEQYELLFNHVRAIGSDVWDSMTIKEKSKEIKRLI